MYMFDVGLIDKPGTISMMCVPGWELTVVIGYDSRFINSLQLLQPLPLPGTKNNSYQQGVKILWITDKKLVK